MQNHISIQRFKALVDQAALVQDKMTKRRFSILCVAEIEKQIAELYVLLRFALFPDFDGSVSWISSRASFMRYVEEYHWPLVGAKAKNLTRYYPLVVESVDPDDLAEPLRLRLDHNLWAYFSRSGDAYSVRAVLHTHYGDDVLVEAMGVSREALGEIIASIEKMKVAPIGWVPAIALDSMLGAK